MKLLSILSLLLLLFIPFSVASAQESPLPLDKIKLPPGFSISLWAKVPDARAMTLGDGGTVFVGSKAAGNVYAISEKEGKRKVHIVASNLKMPAGVAFQSGALYVSAVDQILRFDNIENNLDKPISPHIINADYPSEKHHGWRFIAFGPDGWLYVPVGAPCNVCEADPAQYAIISRIKPDGSNYEVFVQGVRNTVGFDWHPISKKLWFTDNGRDWMGDDLPPDELNHAPNQGMHFGFPYCYGREILDPKFGAKQDCSKSTPPAVELDAHVAPLGMRFYTGNMFPKQYHNQIFIAEHGSWNRRAKIGYRLEWVQLKADKVINKEIFAEGWLVEDQNVAWGRPVDVLVMPDGALLVSDDLAGAVYRISYKTP